MSSLKKYSDSSDEQPSLKNLFANVPWKSRITTRFFLWVFLILSIAFFSLGYVVYQNNRSERILQEQQRLSMKSRIFMDNLSRLMSHGDVVGSRDLLHAHSPLSNGTYLLRPDGKTLAFSDLAVLMEMKNRNILLPTLGAARRIASSRQWKKLSAIPLEIRSYQMYVRSRPDDPQPYFLRLKSRNIPGTWLYMAPVMNGPSCFSCHDQKPVLGMVAVTESTSAFDSEMTKQRSHLFWGFMGTLETIVVILLYLIRRQLVRPIIGVSGVIGAISEKDLDLKKRLPLNRVDEIGRLAFFVNRFIDLFQGWVGEISDRVEWVLTHSELLSRSLEQEKKEDKEEFVRLLEIQNRLMGVRREMGLGPDSIRPASDNLIHLMERTTILQAGIQGILNSIVDAEKISRENTRDLDLIRDGQNQLETLLSWIKDIGERTNMVALNATIQASQAGPHGLAFRVVSDSLSQLAQKTQEITGESSAKIASLQVSLKTLAHSFDAGLDHVSRAGRGLVVTQGDLERVSALMSQLGKTLTVLDERILSEVNMLAQIERDVRALSADRKIRDSRKPLDEKRLEEILRVARELQDELRRFKI